jgi:hypothetical protein
VARFYLAANGTVVFCFILLALIKYAIKVKLTSDSAKIMLPAKSSFQIIFVGRPPEAPPLSKIKNYALADLP